MNASMPARANEHRSPAPRHPHARLLAAGAFALAAVLAAGAWWWCTLPASLHAAPGEELHAVGAARDGSASEAPGAAGTNAGGASAGCPPGPDGNLPADPYAGEGYARVEETGFVSTAARPLSTFSADVDTASYANLRRMVRDGAWPADIPPGAVRTEELLNYFDYRYAPPEGDDLFGISAEMADCPWNPDTKLLVMGFATAPAEPAPETGSNLVFLVDVSGSMADPDKLPLLQEAFATLVQGLGENDRVSLVTYSGEERVVLEGASGADRQRILRAVGSLRAEGSTNGEAGLRTAYDVAERNFVEGGANRIVMASDGDLNVGMTSEDELHDFVDERRGQGVYLSVLGFGTGNYQDAKMEVLADHGDGSYHYIDCAEEARRVLGRNLLANFTPLADDVKLQVEFNPVQVKGYRLIGYENRALADEDFLDDAADAGEVGAGHAFTVAYEVVPVDSPFEVAVPQLKYGRSDDDAARAGDAEAGASGGDGGGGLAICTDGSEWLTCSVRYRPAGEDVTQSQARVVGRADQTDEPSSDWRLAAAVAECAMVLRHSPHAGTATLQSARDLVDAAGSEECAEFARLLETLALRSREPAASSYADGGRLNR